jgi:hypothetical protein
MEIERGIFTNFTIPIKFYKNWNKISNGTKILQALLNLCGQGRTL